MPQPKRKPLVADDGQVAADVSNDPYGQRLGINLFDLDRMDPTIRQLLLGGKLDLRREAAVKVDKERLDETCIPFTCDLLTAACICDTIRSHDRRAKDPPTRVYLFKQSWQRVPYGTVLSLIEGGKPVLNPSVFRVATEVIEGEPPPDRRVFG